ncbi:vomeronasal type-2 receptor 1-like [Lissotriton helveticus]
MVSTSSDLQMWKAPVRGASGATLEASTSQRTSGNQHVLFVTDLEYWLRDHNNSKDSQSSMMGQSTIKIGIKAKLVDVVRLKAEVDEIISGNLPLDRIETYEPDNLLFVAKDVIRSTRQAHDKLPELAQRYGVDVSRRKPLQGNHRLNYSDQELEEKRVKGLKKCIQELVLKNFKKNLESLTLPRNSVFVQYIDDLLVMPEMQEACRDDTIALLKHLADNGHKVSLSKLWVLAYAGTMKSLRRRVKKRSFSFNIRSYHWARTIDFAVHEINQDRTFLPNVTLGVRIFDVCLSLTKSLRGLTKLLAGDDKGLPNYRYLDKPPLPVIIADSGTTKSIAIGRWLGLHRYPQISYFASSTVLSDKVQFPSFFRTIPSDDFQARGLAQLILHYLKSVSFRNKLGEEMSIDSHGDPPAVYDIVNWQSSQEGTIQHVKVGSFNSRAPKGQEMFINFSAIKWNMAGTEIPRSVCSESCVPGYRKAACNGQPTCCFDCIQCSEGEMSNEKDARGCQQCPSDQWSNDKRNTCVPKQTEFLSYHSLLGIVLVLVGIICSLKTLFILVIFVKYADTPVAKANNRVLTYILLGALMLSFLCSFLFIGKPEKISCVLRQPAFGVIFAGCISCILSKTIMVVIAFNATKPGSNTRTWLGPWVSLFTVSGCTLVQVIICATWLLLCPPFPENNMKIKTGTIVLQCNECSETAFLCMLSYMGMLAGGSFVLAFLSRNLPDTFNEAKWITFSMLVFLSVWVSFVPGYLSTQGKYTTAMEIFAIISSSAGILICIFLPKCFIILFRPEINTRDHLLRRIPVKTRFISSTLSSDIEIRSAFKDFFKKIYQEDRCITVDNVDSWPDGVSLPSLSLEQSAFLDGEVTEEEVTSAILGSKSNKAAGPDGLPAEIYKNLAAEISPFLVILFNYILQDGTLPPTSWNSASITLILKPGGKEEDKDFEEVEEFFRLRITATLRKVLTLDDIRQAIAKDNGLQLVEEAILNNAFRLLLRVVNQCHPEEKSRLSELWKMRDELRSMAKGVIMRCQCIDIPKELDNHIIALTHEEHQGVENMKAQI